MELSEKEIIIQLLNYIEKTSYLKSSSKGKEKNTRNIIPLILLIGTVGSILPILPAYTQQIILLEFNTNNSLRS